MFAQSFFLKIFAARTYVLDLLARRLIYPAVLVARNLSLQNFCIARSGARMLNIINIDG